MVQQHISEVEFIYPFMFSFRFIAFIETTHYSCHWKHNRCKHFCRTLQCMLTHWGRVTHICVSDLTIIGSDNGLSPGRRQAIIRTSAGILLIRPLRTNFSEILIEILIFSFKKMRLKVLSAKWQPFCLGFNVLKDQSPLPLKEARSVMPS